MERTIYIDVLYFINFCADFSVLYLTGKLMHLKLKFSRLIFSSFFGALYGVFCEIYITNGILKLFSVILILFLMTEISFKVKDITKLLKVTAFCFVMSFTLSGVIDLLINVLGFFIKYIRVKTVFSNPLMLFIVVAVFCFGFVKISRLFFSSCAKKTAEIQIKLGENVANLTLLCDSGNLLRDPYSNLPVLVVKQSSIKNIMGDDLYNPDLHIRFIPAKTASGMVVFCAFKPDKVSVISGGKIISELSVIVAIDQNNQADYAQTDGVIFSALI